MKKYGFLFSSDIHGNRVHVEKIFRFALKNSILNIILGGDLCPKDIKHRTIKDQLNFLKHLVNTAKKTKK